MEKIRESQTQLQQPFCTSFCFLTKYWEHWTSTLISPCQIRYCFRFLRKFSNFEMNEQNPRLLELFDFNIDIPTVKCAAFFLTIKKESRGPGLLQLSLAFSNLLLISKMMLSPKPKTQTSKPKTQNLRNPRPTPHARSKAEMRYIAQNSF